MYMKFLKSFLPWLKEASMNTPHWSRYHKESLYIHTLLVVKYCKKIAGDDECLIKAAYLHDIGKPSHHGINYRGENCFYHHEDIDSDDLRQFLDENDRDFHDVLFLIKKHMLPFYAEREDVWGKAAKEELERIKAERPEIYCKLMLLHQADVFGCIH